MSACRRFTTGRPVEGIAIDTASAYWRVAVHAVTRLYEAITKALSARYAHLHGDVFLQSLQVYSCLPMSRRVDGKSGHCGAEPQVASRRWRRPRLQECGSA